SFNTNLATYLPCCRYCNRLPSDPFTHLTPRCELMELPHDGDSPMYTCVLQLPINSHVREPIQGAPMPSVLLAQQAVAMETCKILYHSGELDENLMPIGKETVKYAEELDPWKREISSISGRPGSTKKRQTYNKDSNLFMYEVRMRIRVPLLDELNVRRRRLFFPEDTTRCFGILTTKLLPQIPGFPIFTRSGEESCQLKFCRGFIQLSPQQVKLVRIFHRYVFSDMLRVDRVPLSFQPEQSSSQLLVVVLNKAYSSKCDSLDIDWSFMMRTESKRRVIEKIKSDPWYKHRMTEMNKVFVFNRELYEDGVVVAKYRSLTFYKSFYVAELKDDMTPQSSFPSSEYQSFQHYYKVKYGLNIRCLKQPLLDVDHTSSRLNLLTPRHLNQKGKALPMSSLEKKRAKYESLHNRQILVPELCEVHPIPASLWRKAVCLPSVLYRVSQLLIAEELRQDIAVKSGITMETPPLGHIWSNLHFGWSDNSEEDLQENPNQLDDQKKQNEKKSCFSDQEQNNGTAELLCNVPAAATLQNQSYVSKEASERLKTPDKVTDTVISSVQNSDEVQNQNQNNISENVGAELTSQASSEDMSDEDVPLSSSDDDSFFSDDHEAHFELSDSEDSAAKREEVQKCERKKRPRKKSKELENVIEIPRTVLEEFVENYQTENLFIGPGPGLILQALTLSNASDGFNLERLEMLGDSFLKHAVTVYLYCTYPEAHEGKLSYMRSKKVSNYNLYRIGKQFGLAGKMTGLIFDPTVNWLPTGFVVGASGQGDDSDEDLSDDDVEIVASTSNPTSVVTEEEEIYEEDEIQMIDGMLGGCIRNLGSSPKGDNGRIGFGKLGDFLLSLWVGKPLSQLNKQSLDDFVIDTWAPVDSSGKPLNNSDPLMLDLHTQHSLADKSIADCVEAILGAYLTTCGHRSAQLLLCHLGLNVLPKTPNSDDASTKTTERFGFLIPPPNKMLDCRPNQQVKLDQLLVSLSGFERKINYKFKNKAYLLQAFTHASYYYNTVTDCYQRLEFLGDAVLDFLITRHLFNDERQHSPGALTDLRSALVNNTIFASLAVHYDFHKYFKSISPELHRIVEDFVRYQHKQEDAQGMDAHLMRDYDRDEEEDETEDVEVPKALGDIFESVAGAIYMDSGMDLSAVWGVYSLMMLPLIERFSSCVPRSPVRELLEMEPETAKFSCAEKRYDGKVRVTVEIIGKGRFKGVGRSYRIAKSAAARRALRFLK
uniref:ribonuclease III n=1 Tax=Ciona savignyi TaxID=51511 RepID=H2YYK2_CIOSA